MSEEYEKKDYFNRFREEKNKKLKNDLIHLRIQQLANVTSFYYHMSYECYKRYVHFAKPETPSTSTVNQEQDEQDVETSPYWLIKRQDPRRHREHLAIQIQIYISQCV